MLQCIVSHFVVNVFVNIVANPVADYEIKQNKNIWLVHVSQCL